MSRFNDCLKFVLSMEGGYCDNPSDRGGATNCGITQGVYDEYRTSSSQFRMPVVGISADEISAIYRSRYWKPVCGDNLPRGLDLVVFDSAVNHGVRQASKFLQRALGVDDDGIIGNKTIAAVHSDDAAGMTAHVIGDILDQRTDFYDNLVQRDNKQKVFLKGWLNRITHLRKELNNGLA